MNKIINRIEKANHVVVIAHINPDADSLGSASAFYTYLLQLHKKVSFFCATKNIDQKFSFLPWFDKIKDSFANSADLAISLDCANESRLGVDLSCDLINIDHHETNSGFGSVNLVDSNLISTTHILYNFFVENEIKINKKMATALYAGLLDDSNGFLSPEADNSVLKVAQELIELGADKKLCDKYVMQYQTLAGLRLKAIMLSKMQLHSDARVALFLVSNEDMKKSGAVGGDCENPLEESLFLPTVDVGILVKENRDMSLKVSIRSSGELNASEIATGFGGGGHKSRAGFILDSEYTLQNAAEKILQIIDKGLKFGKK